MYCSPLTSLSSRRWLTVSPCDPSLPSRRRPTGTSISLRQTVNRQALEPSCERAVLCSVCNVTQASPLPCGSSTTALVTLICTPALLQPICKAFEPACTRPTSTYLPDLFFPAGSRRTNKHQNRSEALAPWQDQTSRCSPALRPDQQRRLAWCHRKNMHRCHCQYSESPPEGALLQP